MAALIFGAILIGGDFPPSSEKDETAHALTCALSAKLTYEPPTASGGDKENGEGENEEPTKEEAEPPSETPEEPGDKPSEKPLPPSKVTPDDKGMMKINGVYVEAPKALNTDSAARFCQKLSSLRDDYLSGAGAVKLAVIPDKSYYVREFTDSWLDHGAITAEIQKGLGGWDIIELESYLSIDDYYVTDRHWRQERIMPVAGLIASSFGFQTGSHTEQSRDGFIGDYRRNIGDGLSETIVWLENDHTKNATVDNFQHPEYKAVYQPSLLSTSSPYDIFLGGPSPLVTITNPQVTSDRQLVIFCDSYASSLAPLLLEGYSRVVLVDLRYMASSLLPDYVSFEGSDVLFLYSAELVNNSSILR